MRWALAGVAPHADASEPVMGLMTVIRRSPCFHCRPLSSGCSLSPPPPFLLHFFVPSTKQEIFLSFTIFEEGMVGKFGVNGAIIFLKRQYFYLILIVYEL